MPTLTIQQHTPLASIAKNLTSSEQERHYRILDDNSLISKPVDSHYDSDVVSESFSRIFLLNAPSLCC